MALTQVPSPDQWLIALAPLAGWPDAVPARNESRIARLWIRFCGWYARRATERALASLDRATLKDLGISPSEIASLVHGTKGERTRRYDEDWWRGDRLA